MNWQIPDFFKKSGILIIIGVQSFPESLWLWLVRVKHHCDSVP